MNIKDQLNMQSMYDRQAKEGSGFAPSIAAKTVTHESDSAAHELSDAQLRDVIKSVSGNAPGPRTSREKMIERFDELQASDANDA